MGYDPRQRRADVAHENLHDLVTSAGVLALHIHDPVVAEGDWDARDEP